MAIENSIVGDLINFRGLVYAPLNENGVIFVFGKVADDLNMYIEEIKPGFPDCIGRRYIGKGWERVAIEFEFQSKNFVTHKHDPTKCDMIICWEHNWPECPIEVIELKTEIQSMENYPISRPESLLNSKNQENCLGDILKRVRPTNDIERWYTQIFDGLRKLDDSIWAKYGKKYIGWYCPERAFCSVVVQKQTIRIECFSRGEKLIGTKVSSRRFSPRWCVFSVKSEHDIEKAIGILSESYKRIKAALKSGEQTSYFSGGEQSGASGTDSSDQEDVEE